MKPKLLLVLLLALSTQYAAAAVIERDWHTPGDRLLTFDTVNHREWLDLPLQLMMPVPRYDSVAAELGPGGAFENFTMATLQDVRNLAISAGMNPNSESYVANGPAANRLIDLLGVTTPFPRGLRASQAQVAGSSHAQNLTAWIYTLTTDGGVAAGVRGFGGRVESDAELDRPVFLYRNIPEPLSHTAAPLALAGGILMRKFFKGRTPVCPA
jgi:hypothetical protein